MIDEKQHKPALYKKYDVDGIPFYLVADRKGNIKGGPGFRDFKKLKAEILRALAE